MIIQESINQTIRSFHSKLFETSTIMPQTLLFPSTSQQSTISPISSSTITTTDLHYHHQNGHNQNHLILNLSSETTGLVYGLSEWMNVLTLGCLIFLFCLLVFVFSLLFLLSFRRTETFVESKDTKTTTENGNSKNTTIGMGNSRKCQPTFITISDDNDDNNDGFRTKLNTINRFIGTENIITTTPCAITSLEDDRRQADEVEKEREISLFITTSRYNDHSEHHNRYFRSAKDSSICDKNMDSISTVGPESRFITQGSQLLLPTSQQKRYRTFNGRENFRSLDHPITNQTSLKRPSKEQQLLNGLRKHQAMNSIYNIDLNQSKSIDNHEKYHNSYSEVIEELKNRFEILSTAV